MRTSLGRVPYVPRTDRQTDRQIHGRKEARTPNYDATHVTSNLVLPWHRRQRVKLLVPWVDAYGEKGQPPRIPPRWRVGP
eukprot:scaffold44851_cov60-Phaeocystis_antarctica.AAC.2